MNNPQPLVYLAGPITGQTYGSATSWREFAADYLAQHGIKGVSPMRHKDYLADVTNIADQYDERVLSTQKAITTRDRNDVLRCDGVLGNFLGADRMSGGTFIEYGWADLARKPVVTAMDLQAGNPNDHAMLREISGVITPTLEEALWVMARWLS